MPRSKQEITDEAETLTDRFESYTPRPGDERAVVGSDFDEDDEPIEDE